MSTSVTTIPGTIRPLWRLVWPVLAEQVLTMMVGLSDTLLAGHYLDRSHLAAMTVVAYMLWALTSLPATVAIGATAMTARFVGAGDHGAANRATNQSYLGAAALAAIATTLGYLFGEPLLSTLQLDSQSAELAARFFRFVLPVLPAMIFEVVGIACLRGAGDMVSGLLTMVAVNVVNIAVSWSLLLGIGPLPRLGWDGIALGTASGHIVGGLIPLGLLIYGRSGLRIHARLLRPDRALIRRILRIGLPGGLDALSVVGCQLVFLSIVNRLGQLAVAAHGVAIRIESLAYLPGAAFQVAAATLAGQYLGARNHRQATRSVLVACLLGSGVMLAAGILLYSGADWLVHLFLSAEQTDVATVAAPLLRIISVVMLPFATMMILTGALRGAGDTRWPLLFTLIGFVGVRMPAAYLLAHRWNWGVRGAWYAMVADLTVRCALVVARFASGAWKRIEV